MGPRLAQAGGNPSEHAPHLVVIGENSRIRPGSAESSVEYRGNDGFAWSHFVFRPEREILGPDFAARVTLAGFRPLAMRHPGKFSTLPVPPPA